MSRDTAPDDIVQLADARAAARRARDWSTADDLRSRIEAAGWKLIDVGTLYDLERASPPDVRDGETVRYGSSTSVPSRFGDAPEGLATVVLVATDWPDDVARTVNALVRTSPAGTQVIVVANGESTAQAGSLAALEAAGNAAPGIALEVVRTRIRLGHAASLNAGIRRSAAAVVILLDASVEPQGDLVTPLVDALTDPTVAVVGPLGLVSEDMRSFTEPAPGVTDVDTIEGYAMAFRRSDAAARGPLDEHFAFYRNLDIWWSLVLRDRGEDEPDDAPPRRAVRVAGIPIARHPHRGWASLPEAERDRVSKKNFYRVLKRFASRRDLLAGEAAASRRTGT